MPLWTIISDDLTGLQAIAGEFARLGLHVGTGTSRVPTRKELEPFEIYGFDTATRSLPRADAEARVADVARDLLAAGVERVFKHNDSIMQGHVGAELGAVARALGRGGRPIVYAPACPNRNRITEGSVQLEVDAQGRPLAGGFRKDLREIVEQGIGLSAHAIDLEAVRGKEVARLLAAASDDLVIADAVTDDDLDVIASASVQAGCRVLSGSVGLAAAVARLALSQRQATRPVLVLAGSLQATTQAQVEHLLTRPDCAAFPLQPGDSCASELVPRVRSALAAGLNCVVWTPRSSHSTAAPSSYLVLPSDTFERLRAGLAAVLRGVVANPPVALGGLVAAGGMTADLALRDVLGITQFTDLGWLCEGMTIALACDGAHPGLPIVTKSGGWGSVGALSEAVDRCAGWRAPRSSPPSMRKLNSMERVA